MICSMKGEREPEGMDPRRLPCGDDERRVAVLTLREFFFRGSVE
jgi:hypothetical protein